MTHPSFLYGTAWKDERTAALTRVAVETGFRGIDTANQRKHYDEFTYHGLLPWKCHANMTMP